MLEHIKHLLDEKKVAILVGECGSGKTFTIYQLIKTYGVNKVNLIFSISDLDFKQYCCNVEEYKYIKLQNFIKFSLNNYQIIDTEGYDFETTKCPNIVEALKDLDNSLSNLNQEAVLYLDDCPLKLHQDVLNYLVTNTFKHIKVLVTCIYEGDVKGIENFVQIKFDKQLKLI